MQSRSSSYTFGEETSWEAERLEAVERALDGPTRSALQDAGAAPGWRCWEVGAGRGSIAAWLGQVVGPKGSVLATDLDARWFRGQAPNVSFATHDATTDPPPRDRFNLIHARLVLEHVSDPRAVVRRLSSALEPGGVLVAEDSAGLETTVAPDQAVFDSLIDPWERAGLAVGWNAAYGHDLLDDLRAAGLTDLHGRESRVIAPGGEAWRHLSAGLERLRSHLLDEGVSEPDLQAAIRALDDPTCLVTGPPMLIASGRRPG
jgi:SAM-dependent methyltransferase